MGQWFVLVKQVFLLIGVMGLLCGCVGTPVADVDAVREQVDWKTDKALQQFSAEMPELQQKLDAAPGYIVGTTDVLLLGPLGGGTSVAVLHDQRDNTHTYLDIHSVRMGLGIGARAERFVAVISDPAVIDQITRGKWLLRSNASSNVGNSDEQLGSANAGIELFTASESGVSAGASMDISQVRVNHRLTNTGLSQYNYPNRRSVLDSSGDDVPRYWNHPLPFLGKQAVARGYDLPMPFGIGVLRADVRQDMRIENLEVGFNGNGTRPFRFVSFGADSDLITEQIKVDAWVLPFLNLYGTFGQVNGDLDLDIQLDGDTLLAQTGKDCTGAIRPPVCYLFEGKQVRFPIDVDLSPMNYGAGGVVASGWRDWFLLVPFNVTWTDSDKTTLEGRALTISPRVGRGFALNRAGRLTVFAGGNYLDVRTVAAGSLAIPGTDQVLDYKVDQSNSDRWNLVAGANWDVTPRLSVMLEYDGFIGTRDAFISAVTVRF
ncbi:hypothetical protein [uncultured Alcanivorax sp.]|jgi:lipid-binding SYLF domain-containing protein|uniref:hypothetical protein n=1 Tax=Alcanivorax sp. TaxID=1872427 RepID=UPI0025D61FED|nr:hypothetical protein [uncultured Alcanivorax sp.]